MKLDSELMTRRPGRPPSTPTIAGETAGGDGQGLYDLGVISGLTYRRPRARPTS